MKKKLLFVILILFFAILAVILVTWLSNTKTEKERGNLEEVYPEKEYNDIAKYAYHGEINFTDTYIVFKPETYTDEFAAEYECMIYQKINDSYIGDSYYSVEIEDKEVSFTYQSGALDFYMEGFYDGELTINGTQMEKIDPSELEHYSYGYGKLPPVTKS